MKQIQKMKRLLHTHTRESFKQHAPSSNTNMFNRMKCLRNLTK